jgi:hypothetical protein
MIGFGQGWAIRPMALLDRGRRRSLPLGRFGAAVVHQILNWPDPEARREHEIALA